MDRLKWRGVWWYNRTAYNRTADSNLRRYVGLDPRDAYRKARRVAAPATALLTFAYAALPLRSSAGQALAGVRAYPPRGTDRVEPPKAFPTMSERELVWIQGEVRHILTRLILRPTVGDPVNPKGSWKTPKPFTATMLCARSGPYGLGPDWRIRPSWMTDVINAATVLLDAMPWLRYCALCGRLFFKVKQRQVCSPLHGVVLQSRRRWASKKKGDGLERRGRPRTDYTETAHQAWMRSSHTAPPAARRKRTKET